MWQEIAEAAAPFMQEQRSPGHFEFFGIDVMADAEGSCWLIEINRVPGLETSNNRCKPQEEAMFDEMMSSTLRMVLTPLNDTDVSTSEEIKNDSIDIDSSSSGERKRETVFDTPTILAKKASQLPQHPLPVTPIGFWRQVSEAHPDSHCSSSLVFKNLFNWKAFTSKNKSKLFV
jgi:hypothetical protein